MFAAPLCLALLAALPGASVDSPADDRAIFARLEKETAMLAASPDAPLSRERRIEQCARSRTELPRLAQPASARLEPDEVCRRAAAATVLIGSAYKCTKCSRWHNSLATGATVDPDGIIATNHHVAANADTVAMGVLTSDGRFLPVTEVLAADRAKDVALLRVDARGLPALPLRDDAPAGTPVFCYSHPASSFGCFTSGMLSRYVRMPDAEHRGAVFMQITADYARGSSGGPVLDACGNLVGLATMTSPVLTETPVSGKDAPPATLQMVRHSCATARSLRELVGPSGR